jgi:hypothetical protein
MNTKWIFSLIFALSALLVSDLTAQSDPIGITDTLEVEFASCPRGAKAYIDVYLNNDEQLYGLSIPLRFSSQYLSCDTVIFAGSKLEHVNLMAFTINNDSGYVLFGGMIIDEEPIGVGRDLLARLVFSVSHEAPEGLQIVIDSGFVPPAGDLVLTGPEAVEIFPVFKAGILTVTAQNLPPVFKPLPKQYIMEGETLELVVEAYDRERDEIEISVARLPDGADFDSKAGLFSWTPPHVGVGSAVGNPYNVVFTASDGISSAHLELPIEVIDKNRAPQLNLAESVEADAGDLLEILVAAEDSDFDEVTISVDNLPDGAWYDNQNPGLIHWESSLADSGVYQISISATDPGGASASSELNLQLNSVSACELELESAQAYLGETAIVAVRLSNHVKINSMQLLIKYDPTALELLSTTNVGARTQSWERYLVSHDDFIGRVWVTGRADLPEGEEIGPLDVGDGNILLMNFKASSNTDYAGLYIPIEFEFLDTLADLDNTFTDENDELIGQDQISYAGGSFFIKMYDGLIGDINLNGIAFEIGDVVYYTNYFIDPYKFPLDGARWPNSDVNQDGRPGTVGDLVYLIRIITGDISASNKNLMSASGFSALLKGRAENGRLGVYSDWDDMLGGALFRFACGEQTPRVYQTERSADLELLTSFEDGMLTVLICDPEGRRIISGDGPIIEVGAEEADQISLETAELADIYGNQIAAKIVNGASIPEKFELGQNFPNPFNPTTTISFGLPTEGKVRLKIFNIRGQLVKTLVDEIRQPGYHRAEWNGTDGSGTRVASGVYFYRLKFDDYTETRKMIMLK